MRFRCQTKDCFEYFVLFGKFFELLFVETEPNACWQNAVYSEKAALDLLKLIEHSHNNFFLKVEHRSEILRVDGHVNWSAGYFRNFVEPDVPVFVVVSLKVLLLVKYID